MMDHHKIKKFNIVEGYLLQHLSDADMDAFEEHLLFCGKCRDELVQMEKIVEAIRVAAANEEGEKLNNPVKIDSINIAKDQPTIKASQFLRKLSMNQMTFMSIAAVIVITFIGIVLINRNTGLNIIDDQTQRFLLNPILEEFISDNVRADSFSVKLDHSHRDIHIADIGGTLELALSGQIFGDFTEQEDPFILKILSNLESDYLDDRYVVVFPLEGVSHSNAYQFKLHESLNLPHGLYYYTIEMTNDDDPLYIGRIFIK
ncbi:MAG: hypothetical protein HQ510_03900 [Candidatus Marinimicrobia bacterium]|nr:hypothetical protein [Candidatus Neomarinimicrobiota bacterium]